MLPFGRACLVDATERMRFVAASCLGEFSIDAAVARRVLGDAATRPGQSTRARAHRARLDPRVSLRQWIERVHAKVVPLLSEWQRSTLQEWLDVGEPILAVETLEDWECDDERGPWPPPVRALLSDTLVACGLEPLTPEPPRGGSQLPK